MEVWGLKFALLKFPSIRTINILYFVNWHSLMNLKVAIFTLNYKFYFFVNDFPSRV